jgi:hypothetical protein
VTTRWGSNIDLRAVLVRFAADDEQNSARVDNIGGIEEYIGGKLTNRNQRKVHPLLRHGRRRGGPHPLHRRRRAVEVVYLSGSTQPTTWNPPPAPSPWWPRRRMGAAPGQHTRTSRTAQHPYLEADAGARGAADAAGRRRRASGCRGVESRAVLAQDQTRAWPPKRADPLGTSLVRGVLRSPGGSDAEEGHQASSLPAVRATPVAGWSVRRSWVAQIEHRG